MIRLLRCEAQSRLYAIRCRYWRWHRGGHSYEPKPPVGR